eukprot:gb/GFBE01043418.1/.p1 GENE.gb/GFBE01043418.1/~~gb/GFBE01043418.1/.p1  ORF type:complete len:299 (+),score=62.56 gb/GFBE01043418.1/:1-897(+)
MQHVIWLVMMAACQVLAYEEFVPGTAEIFAVVVDGTDEYLPGLGALAASLLDHNNTRPLVVVTASSPSDTLLSMAACLNFSVVASKGIGNPYETDEWESERYGDTFHKLNAFALPAKRMVLMDADMVVLRNLDALFHPGPPVRAVPDLDTRLSFNSGLMVIEPSQALLDLIKDAYLGLKSIKAGRKYLDGGDQGFLNTVFSFYWMSQPYARLSMEFNTVKRLETSLLYWRKFDLRWIRVLHFVGDKPWRSSPDNEMYPISYGVYQAAARSFKARCPSLPDVCSFKEGVFAGAFAPVPC